MKILFLITLFFTLFCVSNDKIYVEIYQSKLQNDSSNITYSVIAQFFENGEINELYVNKKLKRLAIYQINYIDNKKLDFMIIYETINKYVKDNHPNINFNELKQILLSKHKIILISLNEKISN